MELPRFCVEAAADGLAWIVEDAGFDAADLDRDLIAERLQQDVVSLLQAFLPRLDLLMISPLSLSTPASFISTSQTP